MIGKVLLLALVSVALAQVPGNQKEREIEKAIESFTIVSNSTQLLYENTQDEFVTYRNLLQSRTDEYIRNQTEFQKAAASATQATAKQFLTEAREQNLPREVFTCISKEAGTTLLSLSAFSPKFQGDMQRLRTTKSTLLEQIGEELTQIGAALPGRYQQGVTDLRNSATVTSVRQTLARLEREFVHTNSEIGRIEDRMVTNNRNFERDAKIMITNINNAVTIVKNLGVRNMRECMPTMA